MTELSHIPNIATVTKEFVHSVAWSNPDYFIKNGEISLHRVLHYCGMYLDHKDYLKGIRETKNVLVRCRQQPDLVYYTDIYCGHCRRDIKAVHKGKVYYNKTKWHPMKKIFEEREVVEPDNIFDYIPKSAMTSILEVGR